MRKWNEAKLLALDLNNTENGGTPKMEFDQQWFDQDGALHVNFNMEES